jgi:hypothetical protein
MQETKASQDCPAGSSASVRVPGAREDIYQRTLSNGVGLRKQPTSSCWQSQTLRVPSCLSSSDKAPVCAQHIQFIAAEGCSMLC